MKQLLMRYGTIGVVAVMLSLAAIVWLMAVPNTMSFQTFAVMAVLTMSVGAVAFNSWRNGQATANVGHILYTTETATVAAPKPDGAVVPTDKR
jgi:hypothetical protein